MKFTVKKKLRIHLADNISEHWAANLCHNLAADIRHDTCSFRWRDRMLQYGSCHMCSSLYSKLHTFHLNTLYTNKYNTITIEINIYISYVKTNQFLYMSVWCICGIQICDSSMIEKADFPNYLKCIVYGLKKCNFIHFYEIASYKISNLVARS